MTFNVIMINEYVLLLLLCNLYDGFLYIPFASWAGAAGAESLPLSFHLPDTQHT